MRLSDFDIRLLRVFRTVVETGGFSQAAIALNVGTSTISTHMADLEKRLGFRLCTRGRSGFALTQKGAETLELTLRLGNAIEDFTSSIGALQGKIAGNLTIGLIDYMTSVPEFRIADVMHEFSTRAPEATLSLQVLPETDLVNAILDARVHIGIGPNERTQSGLIFHEFLDEVMEVYCSSDHPLFSAELERETKESILRHRFVGSRLEGTVKDTRRFSVQGDAYGSNLETRAILILSGDYLGFLPTHFAQQWVAAGQMKSIRPDFFSIAQDLNVVTRASGVKSPTLNTFTLILYEKCQSSIRPAGERKTPQLL